mmetsp:Transcript_17030/g.45069  ORF Transcript_17030/g.45069 Transcript_17030/m.45069 type:complete len:298 (-) Transcript_17030:659-1552(-)
MWPRSFPNWYQFMPAQSFAACANSVSALSLSSGSDFGMVTSMSRPPSPEPRALMESISISFCSWLMPHFSSAPGACIMVKATAVPHCIFCLSSITFAFFLAKKNKASDHADWKNCRLSFTHWCRSTWTSSGAWSTSPGILRSMAAPAPNMPWIRPADTFAITSLRGRPSGRLLAPVFESSTLRAARPKFVPKPLGSPCFQASTALDSSWITSWPFAMKCPVMYSTLSRCSAALFMAARASPCKHCCIIWCARLMISFMLKPNCMARAGALSIMLGLMPPELLPSSPSGPTSKRRRLP